MSYVLDVVWKRGQRVARGCRVAAPRCILTLRAAARGSGLLTGQRAPLARLSCVTARAETTPRRVQRVHGSHRKVANIFGVHVNIFTPASSNILSVYNNVVALNMTHCCKCWYTTFGSWQPRNIVTVATIVSSNLLCRMAVNRYKCYYWAWSSSYKYVLQLL